MTMDEFITYQIHVTRQEGPRPLQPTRRTLLPAAAAQGSLPVSSFGKKMTMDEFIARQFCLVGEAEFEEGRLSQTRTLRGGCLRKSMKVAEPQPPRRVRSLRTTISEKVLDLIVGTNDALSASLAADSSPPHCPDPSIAVIGGGASGLACAAALAACGVRAVVFHTGMHGLGGRMVTRMMDGGGKQLVFDHATQFFTMSDERFQKLVEEWIEKGLVRDGEA